MHPVPNELVECILENLYSDKATLRNCALVGRAWAPASQRGIFQHITLKFPRRSKGENADDYLSGNSRLLALFDETPPLASYIRSLELRHFEAESWESMAHVQAVHASTAEVVCRLSRVDELSLWSFDWDTLSPVLRLALTNMLNGPAVTRVSLEFLYINKFAELESFLSHATHLKALRLGTMMRRWDAAFPPVFKYLTYYPSPPLSLRSPGFASSAGSDTSSTPSSAIQLNQLVLQLDDIPFIPSITDWLQQETCPYDISHLRSLGILYRQQDHQRVNLLLQYVGASLRELRLLGLVARQPSNVDVFCLGYTPNLNILMVQVVQNDAWTPVVWIQSLLESFLGYAQISCPLQQLTVKLYVDSLDPLQTPQWDQWGPFDALLEKPQFASLRMVYIMVVARDPTASGVVELLSGKLLYLKRSEKLNVTFALN